MNYSDAIHRIFAYIKHFFTAWNTTGEGIHSPFLFHLVRFVMRDENSYYCFADIERRREYLLACDDELDVIDYGSKGSKQGTHIKRRVCDIAKGHLESAKVGQLLFRLVASLKEHEKRPLEILELGTSLGITTAYLAASDSRNQVTTLEGSEVVLRIAQGNWRALKLENIAWQTGNIDDTLYIYARENLEKNHKPLDIAFVDANHTCEATMRYADCLLPKMSENGMMVIDDIHYSKGMEKAWNALKADERVTTSMDLYHIGILFVNKCFLKRHYRIRLR